MVAEENHVGKKKKSVWYLSFHLQEEWCPSFPSSLLSFLLLKNRNKKIFKDSKGSGK